MVPVRQPRHDELVEVAQDRLERLCVLGRRRRQQSRQLPGLDLGRNGAVADPGEVALGPRGGAGEVVVEGHLFFLSFSICFHVRVFSTSSRVSHARRACPTPSST